MVGRQGTEPVLPCRTLPVELEVIEPVRGLEQRRTISGDRIRQLDAVCRGHESDGLIHAGEYACASTRGGTAAPLQLAVYQPLHIANRTDDEVGALQKTAAMQSGERVRVEGAQFLVVDREVAEQVVLLVGI